MHLLAPIGFVAPLRRLGDHAIGRVSSDIPAQRILSETQLNVSRSTQNAPECDLVVCVLLVESLTPLRRQQHLGMFSRELGRVRLHRPSLLPLMSNGRWLQF